MQRLFFFNSQGLNLAGVLHRPGKKTVAAVIISHGFAANKDRTRHVRLAEALLDAGFAALRFDFGGCGESGDREITVRGQVDDLQSVIHEMREQGYTSIGLLGESLGGLTSVLAYDAQIRALVLWAPVTASKTPSLIQTEEMHTEIRQKGFVLYHKDGRAFRIPREYIEERQVIRQQETLSRITAPVLIIHGDSDEVVPLQQSRDAL